jgi:hypothetical protein
MKLQTLFKLRKVLNFMNLFARLLKILSSKRVSEVVLNKEWIFAKER